MGLAHAVIVLDPGEVTSWLVIGLIAGCLSGVVMKRAGDAGLGDLVMGLTGSFLGGLLIAFVVTGPARIWGSSAVAFIGACVLIALLRLISRREAAWRL